MSLLRAHAGGVGAASCGARGEDGAGGHDKPSRCAAVRMVAKVMEVVDVEAYEHAGSIDAVSRAGAIAKRPAIDSPP
jgi:hypothetical protein